MKASNKRLKFEDNAYNMYHLAKDDKNRMVWNATTPA